MNCYLSHTAGSKARLLALYFIALSQTFEKQSPPTESKTKEKERWLPEDDSQ